MKITEITRWHKWSTILISRYMAGKTQLSSRISGRIIRWLEHCWFKLLEGSLGWSSGALCSIFVRQKIWWKENGGLGDATQHGSLNVTTEHHPTMRYLIYNCHSKVMSNSPKMGHLPNPCSTHLFQKKSKFEYDTINTYQYLLTLALLHHTTHQAEVIRSPCDIVNHRDMSWAKATGVPVPFLSPDLSSAEFTSVHHVFPKNTLW